MSKIVEPSDLTEADMRLFCSAVGELILWASFIDTQLNKALLSIFAVPDQKIIEGICAQLDARAKLELVKKRAKLIDTIKWREPILNWTKRAEIINGYRNIVAHHTVRIIDGKIILHSDQLSKILGKLSISNGKLEIKDKTEVNDILKWIDMAKEVYEEGKVIIYNLENFRAKVNSDKL